MDWTKLVLMMLSPCKMSLIKEANFLNRRHFSSLVPMTREGGGGGGGGGPNAIAKINVPQKIRSYEVRLRRLQV